MLRDAALAYVTYGALAPDGRNAVLLTHGYTSSHLFADGGEGASEGSWAGLSRSGPRYRYRPLLCGQFATRRLELRLDRPAQRPG